MIRKIAGKYYRIVENFFIKIHPDPIIVVGNQKSGTSAIAHLLADFGDLTKTVDIPPLWGDNEYRAIAQGEKTLLQVINQNRKYFSTDLIKEPNLTFLLDEVMQIFPNCRYVFVVRDPRDNIRSYLNRLNIPGNLSKLSDDYLPDNPHYKKVFEKLTETNDKNYIQILAEKWNDSVAGYLKWKNKMVLIRYEDFNSNKVAAISALAGKLNVLQKQSIEEKVDIQYQPKGNKKISWQGFFGNNNLSLIEGCCSERMSKIGYQW